MTAVIIQNAGTRRSHAVVATAPPRATAHIHRPQVRLARLDTRSPSPSQAIDSHSTARNDNLSHIFIQPLAIEGTAGRDQSDVYGDLKPDATSGLKRAKSLNLSVDSTQASYKSHPAAHLCQCIVD